MILIIKLENFLHTGGFHAHNNLEPQRSHELEHAVELYSPSLDSAHLALLDKKKNKRKETFNLGGGKCQLKCGKKKERKIEIKRREKKKKKSEKIEIKRREKEKRENRNKKKGEKEKRENRNKKEKEKEKRENRNKKKRKKGKNNVIKMSYINTSIISKLPCLSYKIKRLTDS